MANICLLPLFKFLITSSNSLSAKFIATRITLIVPEKGTIQAKPITERKNNKEMEDGERKTE